MKTLTSITSIAATICCCLFLLMIPGQLKAQTIEVPARADAWELNGNPVKFETHLGVSAMYLDDKGGDATGSNTIIAKDITFYNGTIEYDVAVEEDTRFTSLQFRRLDDENYEHLYLRAFFVDNPRASGGVQYAAVVDGVNYWDLSFPYQTGVVMHKDKWNHVKLVIRDQQLLAYVNDMERPALYIPILDGEPGPGPIGLDGKVWIANLKISPDVTPGLSAGTGFDPTHNDVRYLRNWQVTEPVDFPFGREPADADLPAENANWSPISAERYGLVNLSRRFGKTPNGERRLTWLKTTITAAETVERLMNLGISDEVYIYLNGRPLFVGKNLYATPGMLQPQGRVTPENAQIKLPLQAGENELLIGVANYFFGWGIIARLNDGSNLRY